MTSHYHVTPLSSNQKTGPMTVTTSSRAECPPTCPFMGNGCYAERGPLAIHWRAVTSGDRGVPWAAFLVDLAHALGARRNIAPLWRHNQAGDLPSEDPASAIEDLDRVSSASRKQGFTYTHHRITNKIANAIKAARAFTVNVSCETLASVDTAMEAGLPAVVVLPSATTGKTVKTPQGRTVVVCPAQLRDESCVSCGLCAQKGRSFAIGFLAHGTSVRRVDRSLA